MVKRVKKAFGLLLLVMSVSLSACSAEELLCEVPWTARLSNEQSGTEQNSAKESSTAQESSVANMQEAGEEVKPSFLSEQAYTYAYHCLTEEGKLWYQDIATALGSMEREVRLSAEGLEAGLDESCIDTVFQCVMNDHPELFYVSGYTYTKYLQGEQVVAISFSGTYDLPLEEVNSRRQEIEAAVAEILKGIDGQASEYDKVKYVYDTIVQSTDYYLDAPDNQNIYSVFVGNSSVCQGYAKAAQYLLNKLGIECTLVQGFVEDGQGHAWNLVKVDDDYYYMDVTWGDASYQTLEGEELVGEQPPEINYDYLCISTEQLLRTHRIENCVPLPECVAASANYYVRQGSFFTDYDKEQLACVFERALANGQTDVTVKCADSACFQKMQTALVENQEIFDYLAGEGGTVGYASNEKQLSLTFWMTNQ